MCNDLLYDSEINFVFKSEELKTELISLYPQIQLDSFYRISLENIIQLDKAIILSKYFTFENNINGVFDTTIEANIFTDYQLENFQHKCWGSYNFVNNHTYQCDGYYPRKIKTYSKKQIDKLENFISLLNCNILLKHVHKTFNSYLKSLNCYPIWPNTIFTEYNKNSVIDSKNILLITEFYLECIENSKADKIKKFHYVYQIKNLKTNKIYIGKHSCNKFVCTYFGSGIKLKNEIKEYGIENFKLIKRDYCISEEEAYNKESLFIMNSNKNEILNISQLNKKEFKAKKRILSNDIPTGYEIGLYNYFLDDSKKILNKNKQKAKISLDKATKEDFESYFKFNLYVNKKIDENYDLLYYYYLNSKKN